MLGKLCFIVSLLALIGQASADPYTQLISYQGRITDSGGNAIPNGPQFVTMKIYDSDVGGIELWSSGIREVTVLNGVFTYILGDSVAFPTGLFAGDSIRYLGVRVGTDPELTPRVPLLGFALRVASIDGSAGGTIIGDLVLEGKATLGENNVNSGLRSFVVGHNNRVYGNYSTIGGGGGSANPWDSNVVYGDHSVLGGGAGNRVDSIYSVVAGGVLNHAIGESSTIGGGVGNRAVGLTSTIAGGGGNTTSNIGDAIGGGEGNQTIAPGYYSTIAGGNLNTTGGIGSTVGGGEQNSAANDYCTVGGGFDNLASGFYTTVGGGDANHVVGDRNTIGGGQANLVSGWFSTIGGGNANDAQDTAATIAGGQNNHATAVFSTISGGGDNWAEGRYSVVPGGSMCEADGHFSMAAGRRAKATSDGSFVWADHTDADFVSGGAKSFNIRSTGGMFVYSDSNATTGAMLAPGSGSWASISDSTLKENIVPVDGDRILELLGELEISEWNYESQSGDVRHIGPMAQDFYRLFGVGDNERQISSVDPDGIALAAIQALEKKTQRITQLEEEMLELRQLVLKLMEQASVPAENGQPSEH